MTNKTTGKGPPIKLKRKVHYQRADADAFDYDLYFVDDFDYGLRGPRVPWHLLDTYHAAIGSAAVFGRFCQQPYVHQLNYMGFPTVNLGLSGARPRHYCETRQLHPIMANCDILLIEFMSSRGYETPFFAPNSVWGNVGAYTAPNGEVREDMFVDAAWDEAMRQYGRDAVEDAIRHTRKTYVDDMKMLIEGFGRRIVFLWLAQRGGDYDDQGQYMRDFSGRFPHFIDAETRDTVIGMAKDIKGADNVEYIDIVSTAGLPQTLYTKHTGELARILERVASAAQNTYYPSPQMHDLAAQHLVPAFRKLVGS